MNLSKGIVVLAQNTINVNYVEQACLLAMSLKIVDTETKISIITNDLIPECYIQLFDYIIPIPWSDEAEDHLWKVANRWKIYHVTPYDETIVLDTDMLILEDPSNHWNFLSNYNLFFVSNVLTYRNETASSDFYRKTFTYNQLPNIYSGFHYFKKSSFSHEFYTWLELIMKNWGEFYTHHLLKEKPSQCSVDVACAIATKILDCENQITSTLQVSPTFVHMKSNMQNWNSKHQLWQDAVNIYLNNDCKLKIGNHQQTKIFHYTEKSFVTIDKINKFRKKLDV